MSRERNRWFQDYLDGRLRGPELEAAEARIRDDPELARRVETWSKVREVLREPAELPPGFYTRARARFEASARPRRWVGHLFTWESAGLAAAVALAFALFVPELLDPRSGPTPTEAATPRVADEQRPAPAPVVEELKTTVGKLEQAQAGQAPVAEDPRRIAPAPPAAADAAAGSLEGAAAPSDTGRRAEAPAPVARSERDLTRARLPEEAFADATADPRLEVVGLTSAAELSVELTRVETRRAWEALLGGENGSALAPLGAPDPSLRLILVAPAGGIDCATVSVADSAKGYGVDFRREPSGSAGCAFLLPRDGRAVFIVPRQ